MVRLIYRLTDLAVLARVAVWTGAVVFVWLCVHARPSVLTGPVCPAVVQICIATDTDFNLVCECQLTHTHTQLTNETGLSTVTFRGKDTKTAGLSGGKLSVLKALYTKCFCSLYSFHYFTSKSFNCG